MADLSALARVATRLRCPVCAGSPMTLQGAAPAVLGCPAGHRYDVARQGHVVLLRTATRLRADTAAMVAARDRVLASGAYAPLTAAVLTAVRGGDVTAVPQPSGSPTDGLVVDLAGGTGGHTAAVLDALPGRDGVVLELSVPALRRAARAHPRLAAVGADLTRPLPIVDAVADIVLAVFAPLPPVDELGRIAARDARLVVVTPTPDHLAGLRDRLRLLDLPAGKADRLEARLDPGWYGTGRQDVSARMLLTRELATDVVAMGPNAWHSDQRSPEATAALPDVVEDTLAVTVSTFRRR